MANTDEERRARAAHRGSWPIRRYALGMEPGDNLSATTTPEERLAMVWTLTIDAWAMMGRELPSYARSEMPGRVIRGGRPTDE